MSHFSLIRRNMIQSLPIFQRGSYSNMALACGQISAMKMCQILILSLAWQTVATSQSSDYLPLALQRATEWGFTTGGAVDLPGGVQGGEFWGIQLRWGRVLMTPRGPGFLRGSLEYAFELVPAIVLRETSSDANPFRGEGTVFGGGITPFYWQYNFAAHPRLVPYINLGAGMLFTTGDFPAGTSSFNFTPQGGFGAYWFANPNRALNIGLRYHHASNSGLAEFNPGHNALYFYLGYSWWR
jgi:hypothetical protein